MIEVTEDMIGLWYVELGGGVNYLAGLAKTARGHHLLYRFRYDGTDPRPFEGNDERHWWECKISDADTERVLSKVRDVVSKLAAVARTRHYEIMMGPGGPEAFILALGAMPWSPERDGGIVIIFLQNPWSPVYAGTVWPRRSWLRALARSRSGRRLKLITDDLGVVHNVAPLCAAKASGITPVDPQHVEAIIESYAPDAVVACGRIAEAALVALWAGPLLCIPHPAHRVVTNELYEFASKILAGGLLDRLALRQRRGGIELQKL